MSTVEEKEQAYNFLNEMSSEKVATLTRDDLMASMRRFNLNDKEIKEITYTVAIDKMAKLSRETHNTMSKIRSWAVGIKGRMGRYQNRQ
ncbi:MAG: hypothetical protein WAV41_06075 [Microgenomates group bacterium]